MKGIALAISTLFFAGASWGQMIHVAPLHSSPKPMIDERGRVHYLVDLVDGLQDQFSDEIAPELDARFPTWHRPRAKNMVHAFEVQYQLQATGMISWVGNSFSTYLTVNEVDRLRGDPRVKLVTEDSEFDTAASVAPPWSDSPGDPRYNEVRSYGHLAMNGVFSADSTYPRIYIVDAGVGYHTDGFEYGAPNVTRVNPNNASLVGCYSHSTHIASIIGAIGNNGHGVVGIVPNAPIVSVSVKTQTLGDAGHPGWHCVETHTKESQGIALDWVKQDILSRGWFLAGIVNFSMNYTYSPDMPTNIYAWDGYVGSKMLNLATPSMGSGYTYPGAFVVQSAGNQNDDACAHAYNLPSGSDGIMVIGGVTSSGDRVSPANGQYNSNTTLASTEPGSNYGSCVEAYAPSQYIWGAYGPLVAYSQGDVNSWQLDDPNLMTSDNWTQLGGTSLAAPHVVGVAAYLMKTRGLNTSVQVESAVRSTLYTTGRTDGVTGSYIYYPQIQ